MPLSEDPTCTAVTCKIPVSSGTCKIPVSSGTAGEGAPAPETTSRPAVGGGVGATAVGGAGARSVGQGGGTVPPVVWLWVCGSRRIGVGSDLARSGSTDDALDLRSSSGVEVEVHGD